MHYNSIDHFLTVQYDTLLTIMEAAQREAGGHYAAYTPDELRRNAGNDLREVLASIREITMDNPAIRAGAQQNVMIGIDLEDLIRMGQALEVGLVRFVEQELHNQPDLETDLSRRIRHLCARFRNNITSVKVDQTLNRLRRN